VERHQANVDQLDHFSYAERSTGPPVESRQRMHCPWTRPSGREGQSGWPSL